MEKNDDYGAVGTNIKFFKNNISNIVGITEYDEKLMKLPNELARNHILGSSLMRRKALEETDWGGVFKRYGDWGRWIAMLVKGWKIGSIPEFLFYYRQVDWLDIQYNSMVKEIDCLKQENIQMREIIDRHGLGKIQAFLKKLIKSTKRMILG